MNKANEFFRNDVINIIKNGYRDQNPRPHYADGSPAHTYSVNHVIRRYDLSKNEFPFCTLRPMAWKSAIKEILWIYSDGSNDLNILRDKYNINYWNDWESKDLPNTIGHRYGHTVKKYHLMEKLLKELIEDPFGRRHIIDLYQYEEFENTDGLFPCAFCSIWNVREKDDEKYLDMSLIQRSGDMICASGAGGINEIQYAALLLMVAKHCGYKPGVFTHFVANEQIYNRHIEQARDLIYRDDIFDNPEIIIDTDKTNFYDFNINDFKLINCDIKTIKEKNIQIKLDLGI